MTKNSDEMAFEEWFKNYVCNLPTWYIPLPDELVFDMKTSWQAAIAHERKRSERLLMVVNKCNDDYWFMINLIEKYSSDKESALKDVLERMKFRKPMFEQALKDYKENYE